ncbi:MAG TPA: response regulator transcription factor [Spirochaetia bacterium]|nr:response regulator transcription factor [Spirochaetia bacterium]
MQASILIIEDVREMADLIRLYLVKEGMACSIAESAEAGLSAFAADRFDLVILDINLPGIDGFEFLQRIRKTSSVPVMIVSARDTDEDMILGLGIGADEFVTKPFSPKVLVARVRAMLRRASDLKSSPNAVKFGDFLLDIDGYLLKRGGEKIPLSTKEFEVLTFLVTHPGRAMTPDTIYSEVWRNQYGDITAVAVYIQRLRKKIETDPSSPMFIETVHGMGYRFNAEAIHA